MSTKARKYLGAQRDLLLARYAMIRHFCYMLQCYYELDARVIPDLAEILPDLAQHNAFPPPVVRLLPGD